MCNLREGFVNLREGFVVAPWRLREAFSKTRSAKASRRRHGRLHLKTIRQIMTSPRATSTVDVIRMSLKEYAWPSHILSIYSRVWIHRGLLILLVVS